MHKSKSMCHWTILILPPLRCTMTIAMFIVEIFYFLSLISISVQMPQLYGKPIVPVNYAIAHGNRQMMLSPMQVQMQQLRAARANNVPLHGMSMMPFVARQVPYQGVPNPYLVTGAIGRNGYRPIYGTPLANNPIPASENGFNFSIGLQNDGNGGLHAAIRPMDSLPDFLAHVSNETINEFKRIIRQSNITYDEKLKQIDALVEDLDETTQERYRQFKKAAPTTIAPMKEATKPSTSPITAIANGARRRKPVSSIKVPSSFDEISEIIDDQTLPEKERWRRIVAIYTELEPRTASEYEFRFENYQ